MVERPGCSTGGGGHDPAHSPNNRPRRNASCDADWPSATCHVPADVLASAVPGQLGPAVGTTRNRQCGNARTPPAARACPARRRRGARARPRRVGRRSCRAHAGANHQDHAGTVAGTDERMGRVGTAVEEVPRAQPPPLLRRSTGTRRSRPGSPPDRLAVVHGAGLARLENVDLEADSGCCCTSSPTASTRRPSASKVQRAEDIVPHPSGVADVEHKPAVALWNESCGSFGEACFLGQARSVLVRRVVGQAPPSFAAFPLRWWDCGQGAYGIRTRATAVRGRRPRPLDECAGRLDCSDGRVRPRSCAG